MTEKSPVSTASDAAVVGLALGACAIGWSAVSGRRPQGFVPFAIVAFGVMVFFSRHLVRSSSPFSMRSLQVAALFAYGAILLAAALRTLRVSEARALLLAFSIAVPLVVADVLVAPPTSSKQPR